MDSRKEEARLQPKLPQPTQHLKDHGDVVSALRELDEKGNGKTKELEDKKTRIGVDEQQIRTDTEVQKKAIRGKWPSR